MFSRTACQRRFICAAIAALIYFTGLGRPGLWEPDEGRYGEIAREMLVSGDYITPHNNWVPYFEKPPLVYWCTAATLKLFGKNELAVRLQAALAGVGSVVVTEALGEAIGGVAVGVMAAIALGLSPLFFVFARFATPDPLLSFFITASLAAFYLVLRSASFSYGRGRKLMLAASALTALGTLTKGPVALLLAGIIGALWLILEKRIKNAFHIRWVECGLLYVVIVVPWFVAAQIRNPGFLHFFFVHEHVQRFLQDSEHGWGPWFFVPLILIGMWPWIFFVPISLFQQRRKVECQPRIEPVRLLVTWFLVVFIFFSIPRAKLGEYILPGLPPLAILAALGLDHLRRAAPENTERVIGAYVWINLAVGLLGAAATAFVAHKKLAVLPGATGSQSTALVYQALLLSITIAVSGLIMAYAIRRLGNKRGIPGAVTVTALSIMLIIGYFLFDSTESFSYRKLARSVSTYTQNGCALASYHHFTQALPFYAGQRELLIGYQGELAPFANNADAKATFIPAARLSALWSDRCVVLVLNRADWAQLQNRLKPATIIACQGKKLALINRSLRRDTSTPTSCTDSGMRSRVP
jgi:4-amino-4-deoxy-L-arabinose transferase-like glycosyltransferase